MANDPVDQNYEKPEWNWSTAIKEFFIGFKNVLMVILGAFILLVIIFLSFN